MTGVLARDREGKAQREVRVKLEGYGTVQEPLGPRSWTRQGGPFPEP